ncbi:MAG: 4-hydroxybenzoate 3-monooxygenase [Hyphomicrobiales bacterium]|nr:4-hydroxybenzoate 3-monooxygenase [Hyphomicrobiales bacterium]
MSKVQVCIIGGGPSGLLLSQLLHLKGVDTIVLEKHSREYVLGRIRAGVLEHGFADLMREAECGERMDREGEIHKGFFIAHDGVMDRVDLFKHSGGNSVVVYGQTELTRDLYEARDRMNGKILHNVEDVALHDLTTDAPTVTYRAGDDIVRIDCEYVIGADGFHGVSRKSMPKEVLREYERVYPFGWLGVLSRTRPASPELIYSKHERGFALCSLRSQVLSRYYIQVQLEDSVEDWPDDAFWAELKRRLPEAVASAMITGPSIEKSIAPLRSFVAEPMRYGRLFLAGDAAHIVPPTGAKGLNLAVNDVRLLAPALTELIKDKSAERVDGYTTAARRRVWRAQDFSNYMTQMLHDLYSGPFQQRLQLARLEYIARSEAAARSLAENYVGLPARPDF